MLLVVESLISLSLSLLILLKESKLSVFYVAYLISLHIKTSSIKVYNYNCYEKLK